MYGSESRLGEPRGHEPVVGEHLRLVDVSAVSRSGLVPSWMTRISWGSVFAAGAVVIAVQFALSAISLWGTFGLGKLTSIDSVSSAATSTAVWTGVWAIIALFIGGFIVTRLADTRSRGDALWHGLILWGTSITVMTVLSGLGVAGLFGFGLNPAATVRIVSGAATPEGIAVVSGSLVTYGGYYLLFSVIGIITALAGAYAGTMGMRGRAMKAIPTGMSSDEEHEMRGRHAA